MDRHGGILEEVRKVLFIPGQRRLSPITGVELADLAANNREHLEQSVIRLANFAAEEFHDPKYVISERDRETKRAMKPFPGRNRTPGEIRVPGDVGNPGRLSAGPDPAGQSDARAEGLPATDSLELWYRHVGSMPDFHAGQNSGIPVHAPEYAHLPVQQIANRFEDSGRGSFESRRIREYSGNAVLGGEPLL